MENATYTMQQSYKILGERVPKPTIRHWTGAYSEFLSDSASPGENRNRVFTHDDMIILNTIRYLTQEEGLNTVDSVKTALNSNRRVTGFPEMRTEDEEEALQSVRLVEMSQLERVYDQVRHLQVREEELTARIKLMEEERDQALILLSDRDKVVSERDKQIADLREDREKQLSTVREERDKQIADLREERGRIRGIMFGVIIASVGLLVLALVLIVLVMRPAS